jgi:hypothetical protein
LIVSSLKQYTEIRLPLQVLHFFVSREKAANRSEIRFKAISDSKESEFYTQPKWTAPAYFYPAQKQQLRQYLRQPDKLHPVNFSALCRKKPLSC